MANTKIPSELIADNSIGITQLNVSDGTNGQALTTNGSGTLSFATIQGYTDSDVETYISGGTSTPILSTTIIGSSTRTSGAGGTSTGSLSVEGISAGAAFDLVNTTTTTGRAMRIVSLNTGGLAIEDLDNSGAQVFKIDSNGNTILGDASSSATRQGYLSVISESTQSSGFNDITEFLAPSQAGGGISLNVGVANSSKNLGKLVFNYSGTSGSDTNSLGLGFYGADNLLVVEAGGNIRFEGTGALTLNRGTTAQRPSNPVNGMLRYNTTTGAIEEYALNSWNEITQLFSASGGTVTTDGTYTYHTFTSSGTWTVSSGSRSVEYLIVAGGGAGGGHNSGYYEGGGGGAGGMQFSTTTANAGSYSIVVGAGGTGAAGGSNTSGSNSSAFGVTSIGGGKGGAGASAAANGGSGGGSGYNGSFGTGTTGQGNNGGTYGGTYNGGGGGGGKSAAGGGANSGVGGAGGEWPSGSGTYYAGGGGGGRQSPTAAGGVGGGGDGQTTGAAGPGQAGTANTGGGGGGGWDSSATAAGNGGSGIVIIRYVT